jgi:hypothetical protein
VNCRGRGRNTIEKQTRLHFDTPIARHGGSNSLGQLKLIGPHFCLLLFTLSVHALIILNHLSVYFAE